MSRDEWSSSTPPHLALNSDCSDLFRSNLIVPERGLEPPRRKAIVPKTIVYTISPLGLSQNCTKVRLKKKCGANLLPLVDD